MRKNSFYRPNNYKLPGLLLHLEEAKDYTTFDKVRKDILETFSPTNSYR